MRSLLGVVLIALAACGPDEMSCNAFGSGAAGVVGGVGLACGDGRISGSEQCDDGNRTSGDGCSSTCQVESGYYCRDVSSNCYPAGPVYDADADDVHLTNGTQVAQWDASPLLLPITGGSQPDSNHEPVLETNAINGHQAVLFNGAYNGLEFSNSTSAGAAVLDTLKFDIFLVVSFKSTIADFDEVLQTGVSSGAGKRNFEFFTNQTGTVGAFFAKGDGTAYLNKNSTAAVSQNQWHLIEFTGDGTSYKLSVDGGAFADTTAFANVGTTGEMDNNARLAFNGDSAINQKNMAVARVLAYTRQLSSAERTILRASITKKYGSLPSTRPTVVLVGLGDSITLGQHVTIPWPEKLEYTLGANNIAVGNSGVAADTTSNMLTRWTARIRGKGFTHINILGCVNDLSVAADTALAQSSAEASCESNLGTVVTQAVADGMEVCLNTLTPWSTFSGSSVNRQNATQTFNAWARAQAATHVHIYDAAADPTLGTGTTSVPGALLPGTDSGDHLHPSQAGADVQMAGVRACFGI